MLCVTCCAELPCENGLPKTQVYCKRQIELPVGTALRNKWDLLVVENGQFLAGIEFKSQVGSFGNNTTTALKRQSVAHAISGRQPGRGFKPSPVPGWATYAFGGCAGSSNPVRAQEPHFRFSRIQRCVVRKRYEILLTKLVRERLYDSACFLLSGTQERAPRKL